MSSEAKISNKVTFASLLVTLGIIYGDIGTSPLYVLKALVGNKTLSEQLVLGGISCIFWTLFLQTTVKYIWITLKADNHGEGGIFSLYALVYRYRKRIVIPTILGATALLADGIITPPISVSSAIEGLRLIEGLESLKTVPIVVLILSMIFLFQRFGTQKVGKAFGPVMVIWFSMLFLVGLSQLYHFPWVLKALNPLHAYNLLVNYPQGFWLLGAVFLATTGAEALYSDLGHCGIKNIRITWGFVKTALMTNYMGQGAWLIEEMHRGQYKLAGRNPFFEMMPEWFLIPGIIVATLAAIIASQALISGSFTLISEAVNLNFWPRVAIKQPSDMKGQIYIPSVNTMLWIGCVSMILYFRNSSNMEAAYGFFITIAMLMTTILLGFFLYYRLKMNIFLVLALISFFITIETSFFIANLVKIKENWMFLFFGFSIFFTMYIWYHSRKINNRFTKFTDINKYAPLLIELSEDRTIPKYATHLIYLTKANYQNEIEEKIINSIFAKKPKRADVYWFVHVHKTENPYTLSYDTAELIPDKLIKINIHVGFRVQLRTELYFKKIVQEFRTEMYLKNIVQELASEKKKNWYNKPDSATKYNSEPDFKFVIIEKYLSVESEPPLLEGLLMQCYFWLKRISLSDQRAFGLDKSDVAIEHIPLIYNPPIDLKLTRNDRLRSPL